MENHVHLLKLCVGAEKVDDLERWHANPRSRGPDGLPRHVTRMWPKREADILNGGSLYWVFKGVILARQRILRLDEVDRGDGIRRCGLVLEPQLHRTEAVPRRPFQGWRYLSPGDAPRDLAPGSEANDDIPPTVLARLAEIGIR